MISRCLLLAAILGVTALSAGAGDWPQFRGPGRDNKVTGFTAPAAWPKELKKEWSVSVGDGVGAPVLFSNRIYTFTRVGTDEVVRCFEADTGKPVWSDKYSAADIRYTGDSGHKGPRNSPAVGDGKVCTFGVGGRLSCYDAATGKLAWKKDTKGTPMFHVATSPLVAEGKCVVHTGTGGGKGRAGKGDLTAYDLASGEEKWKWSGDGPGYGSPVLGTIQGIKQVVEQTDSNLIGVDLENGKLLWKVPLVAGNYQSFTPIVDGNMVVCAGTAFAIEKTGDKLTAKQLWKERTPATYNSPTFKDGMIFGLASSGAGGKGGGGKGGGKGGMAKGGSTKLFAQDAKTGAELWQAKETYGQCGEILDAGNVMFLLSSNSNLIAFQANKENFKELAKYKVSDTETWATPIIDGKRIYVKDADSLILWMLP